MDLERLVSDPVLIQITSLLTKLDLVVMEPSESTYILRLVVDRMEGKLEQWRKRLKVMQMRERMDDNSVRVIMHCEEIGVKKSNSASKPSLLKQCVGRPVQCEDSPGVLQNNLEVEHVADIDDPPSAAEEEDIEVGG